MKKTKITVIMAVYNCAETLNEAIDSLLKQTYTDWNCIICDDCSSDDSYAISREYMDKYPDKFYLIRNESNLKLPVSLNRCLKYANAEYIARMDADDISCPERFEEQVRFLDGHEDVSVVGTSMIRFDDSGILGNVFPESNPDKYTLKFGPLCFHATIMMRKSAYDMLNGYVSIPRTVRCEDIDMWFRFMSLGLKADNINKPLYMVREDRKALKRRKLKYSINNVKTNLYGYKLLNFPWYWFPLTVKPVISWMIPYRLKVWRRNRRNKEDTQ